MKLLELRRETVEVLREGVRDRDWSKKVKGKPMPMHAQVHTDQRQCATESGKV